MIYPNLAAEMSRAGISAYDLARVANKSPDTIRNWLKGKGEFPIGKAFAIQEAFFPGVSISYLFGSRPITPEKTG